MKSKIKSLEDCLRLFRIEVPGDIVRQTAEAVYKEIKRIAKVPGFRPGNVPQDLLEKHFSGDAREEVLKRLIPEGYKKALETHKVVPAGMPRIFNIDFGFDKPLRFEAQVDIRPNTKLKNYTAIRVTKKRISVSKEEIDESLTRLRNMYAGYNDVDRAVKKGDYAVCDVEAFADGKPITKKNQNMWVLAEKEASLLGMGEELVGLTKGQSKEVETTLPENYPDKKYAGKRAKFKVLVHTVKEKALPPLDDEFAKKLNAENMDSLKKELESQLFSRKENSMKVNMQNQILERLLRDNRFSVPSSMVKRQKEVFAKRFEEELLRKGIKKEEVETKVKEMDSKMEKDAKERIQIYFILDDIAEKEKISVSDSDINMRLDSIAVSTGQPLEEVRKYYEKENLLGGLAEEIKETKVLEFLLNKAEITEGK
jgi:trigger factor